MKTDVKLNVEADHLLRNASVWNTITNRVDKVLPADERMVEQAKVVAKTLGAWNEDQGLMMQNLQNITVRDALKRLLDDQNVIVLYLNGSTQGGHYQSYLTKEQNRRVQQQPVSQQQQQTHKRPLIKTEKHNAFKRRRL